MEIQKYNKATEILKNIEHIDKVLEFIKSVKKSGLTIMMRECGFVAHPEDVILEKWEFDSLIETYENIKKKLEQELEEL
jgi:uncharacterized protein YjgD (DUF1641 family)